MTIAAFYPDAYKSSPRQTVPRLKRSYLEIVKTIAIPLPLRGIGVSEKADC